MGWLLLIIAGACEMVWPLGFKYTKGFNIKEHYLVVPATFAIMALSLWLMSLATKRGIPIGTAYAVWTGLGAAGTVTLGIILFKEPHDWIRMSCLALIILGVIGLKFLSPPEDNAEKDPKQANSTPALKEQT
jgi:quaternary ammonium compound-resistance protein SugE